MTWLLQKFRRYSSLDNDSQYELPTNVNGHAGASTAPKSPSEQPSKNTPLGKPSRKKMFHSMEIAMAFVALACLVLSILVVSNRHISWYLGVDNRQLIVIGFLLSIMNQCLAGVTPTLFLLLEARVGSSTLQNYDGILRNKPLASKLSFAWRMVLAIMLALPVGLSVAYKTFTGGESSMKIHTTDYIPHGTAASLDILPADYIVQIQELLAPDESWNITAPVLGTVATFNESATEEDFESVCTEMKLNDKTWYFERQDLLMGEPGCFLALADRKDHSNQSLQYIGLSPGNHKACKQNAPLIHAYNIYRQQCLGTWSVSRGGFRLLEGSCDNKTLPWAKQQVIQWQHAALPMWYMSVLIEMLRTFCPSPPTNHYRSNESDWMMPYMSISVATMLWSASVSKQATSFDPETFNKSSEGWLSSNGTIPLEEAGIVYPVDEDDQTIVIYNRSTLRKSPWLYLVLVIQPFLLLIFLIMIAVFYTVPLDKGFGLISILSGIERLDLDSLRGASLSGELKRPVKLSMSPTQADGKNSIKYRIYPLSKQKQRNAGLAKNVEYD
ncbi:hypothetical protein CCHR01_01071 [Colletotrichum chrysophilum]|uniref:Uncharacterized protein n=1 Tax=Colletotrichum chrysophilum TaxID=1836956 RepID=A0AAD9EPY4_9PEZI|nr:hypothetical protein CCHR01_01071 [Colletotrichum chrysophilum]